MIQRRRGLCLLHEATLVLSVRDFLRRQDFDGDEAIAMCAPGFVNHTHPTLALLFDDLVVRNGASDNGAAPLSEDWCRTLAARSIYLQFEGGEFGE